MSKVLLINPSYEPTYGGTKGGITNPIYPTQGLAAIAAVALQNGHEVEIFDLSWRPYLPEMIQDKIKEAKPDLIGITATTPLMNQLRDISVIAKDISKDIRVVGGGAHLSALPMESLAESMLDAVFTDEADYSFTNYLEATDPADVKGIYYRDHLDGEIYSTGRGELISNLDDLPIPAWHLYDPADYHRVSRLLVKRTPVATAEFSRGCVFKCDFCGSKTTMGLGYRKKSPERCAEEVEVLQSLGYREFWLTDDIFTSDQKWAVDVCEKITEKNLDMVWTCTNGIRVESADEDLFKALKNAGCYRVSFGFESGNDEILKKFGKGGRASIDQGRDAVKMARKQGLDTAGTMLLGISHDTEETMMDTINYARTLPLDMMKFGVTIAFPGTPMFYDYLKDDLIRSYDWDAYFIYTDEPLFTHRHLSYLTIKKYMDLAFKKAILHNPSFILRRLIRGFRTGDFLWDVFYGVKFFFAPASRPAMESVYYARDRWPTYDFEANPPKRIPNLVAKKSTRDAA